MTRPLKAAERVEPGLNRMLSRNPVASRSH